MSCSICEVSLPEHEKIGCASDMLVGGIDAALLIQCGYTTVDFTNVTQINADIASGKIRKVLGILGNVPAASPVEGQATTGCGPRTITDTFDRTFVFTDYNVSQDNNDFYDAANGKTFAGVAWRHCVDGQMSLVLSDVTVTALDITPEDNGTKRNYQVTVKWRSLEMPTIQTEPAGIFA